MCYISAYFYESIQIVTGNYQNYSQAAKSNTSYGIQLTEAFPLSATSSYFRSDVCCFFVA